MARNAKAMYFALGLATRQGRAVHCRITRQDGTVVELKWEAGRNIGPSLGKWDGKLSGDDKDAKTEVGWQSKDGQARIFLATWNNDNEWYPVKDMEWILDDDSATHADFRRDGEVTAASPQRCGWHWKVTRASVTSVRAPGLVALDMTCCSLVLREPIPATGQLGYKYSLPWPRGVNWRFQTPCR